MFAAYVTVTILAAVFTAHLRVRSHKLAGWAVLFTVSVAALAVNLGYHGFQARG